MDAFKSQFLLVVFYAMNFLRFQYIWLFLYLLFFPQSLEAQKKVTFRVDQNISQDSLRKIIKKEKLLQTLYIRSDTANILSGWKTDDSLKIFIGDKDYLIVYNQLPDFLLSINDSLIQQGQIFNKIQPVKIRLLHNRLYLYYRVEDAQPYSIDSIVYTSTAFPKNIQSLLYKKFKSKKINRENLQKMNDFIVQNTAFRLTHLPEILFTPKQRLLQITTPNPMANNFDGLFALFYNREQHKLQLQGSIRTRLYNIFRQNETTEIQWQAFSGKQLLDFNTSWPFVRATAFGIKNFLRMGRQDSLKTFIYEKIQLSYTQQQHSWSFSYIYDQQKFTNTDKHKYWALGYHFVNPKNSLQISLDVQYDFKKNAWVNFLSANRKNFLSPHVQFDNHINIMYNEAKNYLSQTQQINRFYRKILPVYDAQYGIASLKNELIWKKNNTEFLIIADYIGRNSLKKQKQSWINAGVGLNFIKNSQILTFEIIKPFSINYLTDYQSVYVNIKQIINF